MNHVGACPWPGNDPLYLAYHDNEWGRPVFDNRPLFEKLCLDGQQAGLAWITILRKIPAYRSAYAQFEPEQVALFGEQDVSRLLADPGIVRNRLKVESVIKNARAYLALQAEGIDFGEYLWSFVDGRQVVNRWQTMAQVPTNSAQSDAMAKALKRRGFSFVGSTICYAFMQAVGMVNDHLVSCPCYQSCLLERP